ncbi:MAG: 50S ribosomal subunit protein L17 [Candidatus Westeberhardia cardiocondylae]|nr:50S ribosomal subunit protein L17 [Candidatus Westeberhardia cardiocondylae]
MGCFYHSAGRRKLNRKVSHCRSMFRNMVVSLVFYEFIKTTLPKAKELRCIVEPLITIAKIDSVSNRRRVFSYIRNNKIVNKIFIDLAPRFFDKPGGYLCIVKCGFRVGDKAPVAFVKFVESVNKFVVK